jgi:hypothetical protein
MLAIGLLVFAVTRPSLPAANYALSGWELATLATVIAIAVGVYFAVLQRWRKALPKYEYVARRASFRGWTTGLTLLAILLAVGWPYQRRIAAEITTPRPETPIDLPVAGVFLFDTSLSMSYQQEGKTRLDVARQIAIEHLGTLPSGSRIVVADTETDHPFVFQSTLGAAQSRIEETELSAVRLPLNDRLRTALLFHEDERRLRLAEQGAVPEEIRKDSFLRRVYVFTDLAASAWRLGGSSLLRQEIERLRSVNVYLIDVGELQPQNIGVTGIALSRHRVPRGGGLVVRATVNSVGLPAGERTAELYLSDGGGPLQSRDKRTVNIEPGVAQQIEFQMAPDLQGPVVHGDVRLVSSDPLPADDSRFFTVDIGPPPKVLVVAPEREAAADWELALNPTSENKFNLEFVSSAVLPTADLAKYDVVCLVNVSELPDDQWYRLGQFADQGGGLAVFLGSEQISAVSYGRGQAQAFLPAELVAWVPAGDWRLSLDNVTHPIFRKVNLYKDEGGIAILENEAQIYKFWRVTPAPGAAVLATYTDDRRSPAIIERPHGKGRVVLFTTSVDEKPSRQRWNTLISLENSWAYLALAQQMTEYLARVTDNVYTYEAGDAVSLQLPAADLERQFLLRKPDLTQTRRTVPPQATHVLIEDAGLAGHYDLASSGADPGVAGFSVNMPADESDFTRLTPEQLDDVLGKDHYQVARDINELKANINIADIGKEVFPVVMLLLIVAFCGEHLVANRFYEVDSEPPGGVSETPVTSGRTPAAPEPATIG